MDKIKQYEVMVDMTGRNDKIIKAGAILDEDFFIKENIKTMIAQGYIKEVK